MCVNVTCISEQEEHFIAALRENILTTSKNVMEMLDMVVAAYKTNLSDFKEICSLPTMSNVTNLKIPHGLSTKIIIMNIVAVALWTVGVFASMYAGYLNPEVRVTSSTLSSIINGFATIIMFIFIDPNLSMMTDDVVEGKMTESQFRRSIV